MLIIKTMLYSFQLKLHQTFLQPLLASPERERTDISQDDFCNILGYQLYQRCCSQYKWIITSMLVNSAQNGKAKLRAAPIIQTTNKFARGKTVY
jgi:hypothetical protein